MNKFLKKKAGVWSDYLGGLPTQGALEALKVVPGIGPVAKAGQLGLNTGSLIHGFSQPVSDADIEAMDNSVGKAFIPGVGASRMIRRMRHNDDKTGGAHPTANVVGETFGTSVPILASIIAGAALGGIIKSQNPLATRHDVAKGSLIGAGIGGGLTGLATLAAWGAAGLTPRRTKAEQKEHDDSTNVSNWLVPGVATYNHAKRFGRLLDEQDEREAKVAKKASAISKKAGALLPFAAGVGLAAATGAGAYGYKKYKENKANKANKAIDSLLRAALVGGTTYLGTGLLDPDDEYRGRRALAALAAATGMGAYDLNKGVVDESDYKTLWEGIKSRYA